MKDFLGKELKVGDEIVVFMPRTGPYHADLIRANIIRFTNKFVCYYGKTYLNKIYHGRTISSKIIKIFE